MGRRLRGTGGEMVMVDAANDPAPVRVATNKNYTVLAG